MAGVVSALQGLPGVTDWFKSLKWKFQICVLPLLSKKFKKCSFLCIFHLSKSHLKPLKVDFSSNPWLPPSTHDFLSICSWSMSPSKLHVAAPLRVGGRHPAPHQCLLPLAWIYRLFLPLGGVFFIDYWEIRWLLTMLNKQILKVSHPGAPWMVSWEPHLCYKPVSAMANVLVTFLFWFVSGNPVCFLWTLPEMARPARSVATWTSLAQLLLPWGCLLASSLWGPPRAPTSPLLMCEGAWAKVAPNTLLTWWKASHFFTWRCSFFFNSHFLLALLPSGVSFLLLFDTDLLVVNALAFC